MTNLKPLQTWALALLLLVLPWMGGSYFIFILCTIATYFIVALALDVLVARAGQVSIGHAAFWAIGAYASAILVTRLDAPFMVAVLAGGALAGLFGLLVALPALRVQGHYLAIATLAFALVVEQILHEWDALTGGRTGMFVPRPSLFGLDLTEDRTYFYVLLVFAALFAWGVRNLSQAPSGRALMALRLSATAAQCSGISRARSLITAFVLSAFLTGISGALFAHLVGYLSVSSFTLMTSLSFLTMIVIGGLGRLFGALIGAAFLALTSELMRDMGDAQMLMYGIVLVVVMLVFPQGLVSIPGRLCTALRRGNGKNQPPIQASPDKTGN